MRRRNLLQFTAVALAAGAAGCAVPLAEAAALPRQGATIRFRSRSGLVSRYRLDPAPSGRKPTGIVIYLHGDGHGEFAPGATILNDYAAVARDNDMLMLAPVTPDRDTRTWWKKESSVQWLRELIEHIRATRAIDDSQIWLAGYSGGAEVITNFLLPDHSDLFTGGGAVLLGGGSLDPEIVFTKQLTPQLKQDFVMAWVVGELDTPSRGGADGDFDALAEARAAEKAYRARGMAHTSVQVLPGETHNSSADNGAPALRRLLAEG